ncbi:MAG: putative membrane protein YdfK [Firmicutes bacterium]|nr:putative membrane protein YdfK [candidate division NPL-UPA2 bacterium]
MLGTIVNALAILAGGILGALLGGVIKEKSRDTVMHGLGLSVAVVGLTMALKTDSPLIVIASLVLGGLVGEWLDIEGNLYRGAALVEKRYVRGKGGLAQGFVTTSLIYCVGAMAIMGSLESGMTGNHATLYAKAMLDGVSAVVFASTLGLGVALSSLSVFVYQGAITLLAAWISQWLTPAAVIEMTATGGILIVAIGLNVLEIKKVRVGNLLPAILFAVLLTIGVG